MLADFLAKMPWTYVREVPHDIIAAHWKLLRNQSEYDEIGEDESYTLHHAACESWIGPLSLNRLPSSLRALSNNEFSPLQRVFSHEDGKFAIVISYHRNETSKKGYPMDPPTWTGTFRRTTLNNRKQSSSISFDADAREFSTVFRIEVFNSPQTTVLRKICEILQRHQLMPSSLDLWSASEG